MRQFAHYNPEILGDVVARDISLPEYAFNTDPAEVLAPRSNWQGEGEDVRTYEAQVMVFYLVNTAQTLVHQSRGYP